MRNYCKGARSQNPGARRSGLRDDQGYLSNATYGTYVTYWSSLSSSISHIRSPVPDSLGSPSPPGSWILAPLPSQSVLLQPPVECTPTKTESLSGSAGITAVAIERFLDE